MKTFLVLIGFVLAAAAGNAATPIVPGLLKPGATAPDFVAYNASNQPVKLSDFAGKTVLLDFWSTWCYPCFDSMPRTEALHKQFGPQGIVVLGVCALDTQTNFNNWQRNPRVETTFLQVFDRGGNSPSSIAKKLYLVSAVPTFYLISKDRKVVFAGVGSDLETHDALTGAIRRHLLASRPKIPGTAR